MTDCQKDLVENPGDDAKKHSDGQRLSCLALAMMSCRQQGAQGNHQEELGWVGQFLKQFNPVARSVQAFPLSLFNILPEFQQWKIVWISTWLKGEQW